MSVNGDRKYKAWWFARYFSLFIGNGVFPNPSTGLQVMSGDFMTTKVKPGDGWINGYFLVNDGDHVLQHDVADGVLKRIDRVVMRLDFAEREIDILIKKGGPASTPVAPPLQRDGDAYELALADVLISNGVTTIAQGNITDLRLNSELCGIVHGTVDQVDTTTIFNQYLAWFEQMKVTSSSDMNDWIVATEEEFRVWFDSIKGILEGDVAANLAAKISNLELLIVDVEKNKASKAEVSESIDGLRKEIEQTSYSVSKTLPDSKGVFTSIEYRRKSNGILAAKSVLSGGISPTYTTRTITYYGTDGLPSGKVDVFTLTYNAEGFLIKEV